MAHIRTVARRAAAAALAGAAVLGASLAGPLDPVSADTTYVVQAGDTLSTIARRTGVAAADLAAANGITRPDLVRVGQKLKVPGKVPAAPVVKAAPAATYTVVKGDTLSGIARKVGVKQTDLLAVNNLRNPQRIRVGQVLTLPAGAAPPAPPAPARPVVKLPPALSPAATRVVNSRYPALPSKIRTNPDRLRLVPVFEYWAGRYGVPSDLLMAICFQESGWQAGIVSGKAAVGVGQLLPPTAQWVATDLAGMPGVDLYDAEQNIRVSARFLRWLIGFHGDESIAIAGYYQGPGSVATQGVFPDTEAYVAAVQAGRWRFRPS